MKNSNLLNRLLSYSHEKQSPQRFGRYAAILIMLLALGVGQVLAKNIYAVRYSLPGDGVNTKCHNWGGTEGTSTVWPGTLMTRWTTMNAGSNEIYTCELADPRNDYAEFVNQNNTSDRSGNKYFPNTYPQPTYANGSWWYSPRLTSALWGSAQHVYGGRVYFDNSDAKWNDSYMYLVIGHDTYLAYYQLTKLGGTKICYVDLGGQSWKDAKYIALAGHTGSKSTDDTPNDLVDLTHFSDANSYSMDYQSTYMITMSSGENCTPINIAYESGGYSAFNYSQTFYRVFNGSATTTNVGSVSISTTKLSDHCAGSEGNSTASIASGTSNNSADAVKTATVTLTASPADGYYFVGWYTAATGGDLVNTNTTMSYTCTGTRTLYARFEQRHNITVNAGANGTTTPSSGNTVSAGYYTSANISASPNSGYYFVNWTKSNENVTIADPNSASTSVTATGTATVTANFAPIWAILGSQADNTSTGTDGFGGWSTSNDNNLITGYTTVSGDLVGSVNVTLEANKDYQFKMYARANGGGGTFYGNNTSTQYMKYTPSEKNTDWAFATDKANCGITTAGAGTYQFKWNLTDKTLTVVYPTSYTVTFGHGTGGSTVTASGSVSGSITTGQYVASGENVTFTQTPHDGYTFKGWYTTAGGNTSAGLVNNVLSSIGANKTVYAQYTANNYTITFNATTNGGTVTARNAATETDGVYTVSATYDARVSGKMPQATKNGYDFLGWYSASTDGSKVIYDDGYFVPSVAGYTDASQNWIYAGDKTLFAQYYQPIIDDINFSSSWVMPGDEITITPVWRAYHNPEGNYTMCFVLVTDKGDELKVQPEFTVNYSTRTAKFRAPSTSGTYAIHAYLFSDANHDFSDRSTNLLSSFVVNTADFYIMPTHTVTVEYKCGDVEVLPSKTVQATAYLATTSVTAPEVPGMSFTGWTLGANVTSSDATNANPIAIHASNEGTLTANYSQAGYVYFKNTLGWEHVYFYKYNSNNYWGSSNPNYGTGACKEHDGWADLCTYGPEEMTKVEGTEDLYAIKPADGVPASGKSFVFTNSPSIEDFFGETVGTEIQVVRVTTSYNATNHMIVPNKTGQTQQFYSNRVKYYLNYFEAPSLMDWGWTLRGSWGWSTASEYCHWKAPTMGSVEFQTSREFDQTSSYDYYVQVFDKPGTTKRGKAEGVLTAVAPGPDTLAIEPDKSDYNIKLTTNSPGKYKFNLKFSHGTNQTGGFPSIVELTAVWPVKVGDFRLIYTAGTKPHPGNVIEKRANGKDTVSMYVASDKKAYLKLQPCSGITKDVVSWTAPASCAALTYAEGVSDAFDALLADATNGGSGTYNFVIQQDADGANQTIVEVYKYTGRFYVRTDCVNADKWNYKESKDEHTMTYSEYSTTLTTKPYSHYFIKDIHGEGDEVNIRFTVATDYSDAITDTITTGDDTGDYIDYYGSETLHLTENVRFTYNQKTNKIWRAYTEGPTNNNYMILRSNGTNVYADNDGSKGSLNSAIKFADQGNWVYQVDAWATPGAYVKLTAQIHNQDASNNSDDDEDHLTTQYLKGKDNATWDATNAVLLLGGSGDAQHMRITYDFKTDRMITSWLPSSSPVGSNLSLHADVMLIRKHQQAGQSITFAHPDNGHYELQDVQTVYGVMQFFKDTLNDVALSQFERDLFWISFPFDVNMSDVFGFGTYGQHWIVEYYDGKGRAKNGYWSDSPSNWKFVTSAMRDTFVLKANEGYILALDLDELTTSSHVWDNSITTVYLYFPSTTNLGTILEKTSKKVGIDTVGYQCSIDRRSDKTTPNTNKDRRVADSHWHCIGVPSFAGAEHAIDRTWISYDVPGAYDGDGNVVWNTKNLPFLYRWDMTYNELFPVKTGSGPVAFKAMHSYLVQYSQDSIEWTNVVVAQPAAIKAHLTKQEDYNLTLTLLRGDDQQDQTFIRLSDEENVSDNFEFNQDLSKENNYNKANIWTLTADYYPVAGNSMPFSAATKTVAVGVKIAADGDHTFEMPEGTDGVGVVLIDNIAGTRTNLALENYTVNLAAGQYDGRFFLEISPIVQSPTDIEKTVDSQNGNIRKVIVDGVLYIVKDGKVFDAQGNRVR